MSTEYGNRLRAARKHAGLTQQGLSKKTSIAQSTISTAERSGNGSVDTSIYARACGVDVHWLATGEGSMVGGSSSVVAEPAASYTIHTPAAAINTLADAFRKMKPTARAGAATLLANMATEPDGHWADWLKDLIEKEIEPDRETAKTDREGIPSSNSPDLEPTIKEKTAPKFGPVLTRGFEAGKELDESQTDGRISKPRGGPST